ncbi:hypothetical protein [Paenibacillus oleatilyticus]|uniref:Uncharacterized protein n=1 Tax=Paenibacillus oleatilyticus TaxID=2594886 RepID=A0ABV4VCC4_9BACL
MIESAIITFCKCCLAPADLCKNLPRPELTYEVEVKLKDVTDDGGSVRDCA